MNQIYACREGKEVPFTDAKISSTATPATSSRNRSVFSKLLLGVFLFLVVGAINVSAQGTRTFNASLVNQTFIVPPGVTSINVDVTGAGGGGSGSSTVFGAAGYGGGGAAFERTTSIAVNPGDVLTLAVPFGGAGGPVLGAGISGLTTTITGAFATAVNGGGGGVPGTVGSGGAGGTQPGAPGGAGEVILPAGSGGGGGGGAGAFATTATAGTFGIAGLGGAGGTTGGGVGGNGGIFTSFPGNAASAIGGGGGGGGYSPLGGNTAGGAGGDARVIITWACPVAAQLSAGGPYGPYCVSNITGQALTGSINNPPLAVGAAAYIAAYDAPKFFGPGLAGAAPAQTFVPSAAGVGTHVINYRIPAADGCPLIEASTNIVVNALPVGSATPAAQTICHGASTSITLNSTIPGTTFTWTSANFTGTTTGHSAGAGGTITQGPLLNASNTTPSVVRYTVTPTGPAPTNCVGATFTVDVTVNPAPAGAAPFAQTICSSTATNVVLAATIPSTFTWTVGAIVGGITGAANGAGPVIAQTLVNPSNVVAGSVTYIVTPTSNPAGCVGAPYNVVVTVNPEPSMVATPNTATICSGGTVNIGLVSSTGPSTFTWIVGVITGGITGATPCAAACGTNLSNTLVNPSSVTAGTVQYIVTPVTIATGCIGTPYTITVTVNPSPVGVAPFAQTICSGATTSVALAASIPSTFTWTVGAIVGGITGASAGAGATIAQALTNPSSTTVGSVTYIVTPTSAAPASCTGPTYNVVVTVNPLPVGVAPFAQTICSGTATNVVLAASIPSTFTWTVGAVVGGITGQAAGAGPVIAQGLVNPSSTTPGTVTYIVTPTSVAGPCTGPTYNVVVTVNPAPVGVPAAQTICSGATTAVVLAASIPSTFTWTVGAITGGITGASASNGAVIAQTLTNPSSTTAGTVTYIVTPTSNPAGCVGPTFNVVITVNPLPVGVPAAQTICSGTATNVVLAASIPSTFTWTVGTITGGITGASAGAGGTITQTLSNPGTVPGTVTYIVTPTSAAPASCTGPTFNVVITVQGIVNGTIFGPNISVCAGQSADININLVGTPNFSGNLSILVLSGVGTGNSNVAFGPAAPVAGPSASIIPGGVTVTGISAITIPATLLTNTSNTTTTYRVGWNSPTSLIDGNGCQPTAGAPLTGFQDVTVYPVPDASAALTTAVDANGDVCPGTTVVYNVTNPNGVPGSVYNITVIGANAANLFTATNVAFGPNGVNTNLGLTCANIAGVNPITVTITPVGPAPLGCFGTPITRTLNVRDNIAPALTSGTGSAAFQCADAAGITAARAFVPTFNNTNCSGAPVITSALGEVYVPSCGYSAPYVAGQTGTLTTTWLATEPCGATNTVTQVITISDNTAPTWVTVPGSMNITLSCTDAAGIAAAQAARPVATDNGCDPTLTITKVAGVFAVGACPNAGTFTNTFTTVDNCNNTSSIFTQVITIVDNTAPVIAAIANQTLNVGAGANCQVPLPDYIATLPITATDCGGVITLTQSPVAGTIIVGGPGPGPVGGSQVVTITATDVCGNSSTRVFTVNLVDATAPIARCHNMTVTLNAAGVGSLTPAQLDGNKNGVAGNGTTTPTGNPWILSSDACGLGTVLFDPANTGIFAPFPASNGNTVNLRNFNCTHLTNIAGGTVGTIPLTIRVTDPSGNFTDCISQITVVDNIAPVITCAPPATYQKNATCVTIMPNLIGVGGTTATDATSTCSPVVITQFPPVGSIIAADVASLGVVFVATDASGNSSTCTTTIQFRDQTPPTISGCPANITVTTGVGNTDCQIGVNWTPPTASDNCSPILGTTTLTSTHLPSGPQTFTFSASGANIPITINDVANAVPYPSAITVSGVPLGSTVQSITLNGFTHTFPADVDIAVVSPATATPASAPVILMSDIGFSTVTGASYTFQDGAPAFTAPNSNVTASPTNSGTPDNFPAPGPGSISQAAPLLASFGTGNMNGVWSLYAVDDAGGDFGTINNWSITFFNPSVGGTSFFVGTTPVTYTATDAAGNTSTCTFTVTVIDNTLPTITCTTPGNKTVNANTGGCAYTHAGAAWDATGTDNCIPVTSIFYTLTGATTATGTNGQSLNGRVFNTGTTTVTWRIVDQYTNSTTCSFTVTVTDTQGPTLTCPANVAINANAAGCSGTVPGSSMIPVYSDNCGVTLVEWSVSGATPASSGLNNIGTFTFNVGTSLVTYRVSDAAGNSTLCSFNVVVTNAVAGAISGTSTVAQNIATTSTITFTGSGAPAGANYTFTYNVNGGATQTVSTTGGSNVVTVAQSNALIGVFTYTLLTVTDNITGCPGAVTPPNTAVITIVNGAPDLTASQLFTTTQVASGGTIDEVVVIRNVGTTATFLPIVFTVSTYSALTGLTVSSNTNPSVTIGFTTYTLANSSWTFNAIAGTFTSNAGVFIPAGGTANIGVRIVRGSGAGVGANGTVNQTVTITNGTGGGETPTNNNTINNSLLKN